MCMCVCVCEENMIWDIPWDRGQVTHTIPVWLTTHCAIGMVCGWTCSWAWCVTSLPGPAIISNCFLQVTTDINRIKTTTDWNIKKDMLISSNMLTMWIVDQISRSNTICHDLFTERQERNVQNTAEHLLVMKNTIE